MEMLSREHLQYRFSLDEFRVRLACVFLLSDDEVFTVAEF